MRGRPGRQSSWVRLVLFPVNETFLGWMVALPGSQEGGLCCPCPLAQFCRHGAQKVAETPCILGRDRNCISNPRSFALDLSLLLSLEMPVAFFYLMEMFCLKNLRDVYMFEQIVKSIH